MLIKPSISSVEDIDDITNIEQKRRYIIIYKYNKPHDWMMSETLGLFGNGNDDVYLINDSVVVGKDYLVPSGIKLYCRNCYRGVVRNPFLDNGIINKLAPCTFAEGTFMNRLHRKNDAPFVISSPSILLASGGPGGCSFEEELMCELNSDYIQPFPKFYNIEDQAWLSNRNSKLKIGDFTYDITDVPSYSLGELIDKYTRVCVMELPSDNFLNLTSNPFYRTNQQLDIKDILESFKVHVNDIYISIQMSLINSIFSKADIIIDLDSGTFNIPLNSLKLKFANIDKEYIQKDFAKLAFDINQNVDNVSECFQYVPDELYKRGMFPNRLTISVSNTFSSIKLSNINDKIFKPNLSKISTSDGDELVQMFCSAIG